MRKQTVTLDTLLRNQSRDTHVTDLRERRFNLTHESIHRGEKYYPVEGREKRLVSIGIHIIKRYLRNRRRTGNEKSWIEKPVP